MSDSFSLEIVVPSGIFLSETVEAVRLPGSEGDCVIMLGHQNGVVFLRPGIVALTVSGSKNERCLVMLGGRALVRSNAVFIVTENVFDQKNISPQDFKAYRKCMLNREASSDIETALMLQQYQRDSEMLEGLL
jgi:F-type H+-transporting ATPase subunit epsilon